LSLNEGNQITKVVINSKTTLNKLVGLAVLSKTCSS